MSAAALLLEARDIDRRHPNGDGWLFSGVSLGITAGTRLSITGPSGAGKTLLLRALAMLDPLDRGQILWKGRTVRRDAIPAFRGSVIYLHQRAALLEETVEASLRRPFSLRPSPAAFPEGGSPRTARPARPRRRFLGEAGRRSFRR